MDSQADSSLSHEEVEDASQEGTEIIDPRDIATSNLNLAEIPATQEGRTDPPLQGSKTVVGNTDMSAKQKSPGGHEQSVQERSVKRSRREPAEVAIEDTGDVLLDTDTLLLKVSSAVLIHALKVLRRELLGAFKEGVEFRKNGEITLDHCDDNGESMLLICKILYNRCGQMPPPSPDELKRLWIHCDKYDCVHTVAPICKQWLRALVHRERNRLERSRAAADNTEIDIMLALACRFESAEIFRDASATMILRLEGSPLNY